MRLSKTLLLIGKRLGVQLNRDMVVLILRYSQRENGTEQFFELKVRYHDKY